MSKHQIESIGFLFGNTGKRYTYEYLVFDMKSSWTFGVGTNHNTPESLLEIINELEGNSEITGGEQTAINMSSLRLGESYTINGKLIICVKGDH